MQANRKLKMLFVLLLPLLAVTMVAGGCATNRPAGEQFDDATITASVKSKFAADPLVSALDIDVDTLNGVVTLSGFVGSAAEKSKAGQIAAATDHVSRVVNNLQIQ